MDSRIVLFLVDLDYLYDRLYNARTIGGYNGGYVVIGFITLSLVH